VYLNIALYKFAELDSELTFTQATLHAQGERLGLKGTILLAPEGVNAFLCGNESAIREFLTFLGNTLALSLEWKESWSETQAFHKWLVKVKKEIIKFDDGESKPLAGRAPAVTAKTLLKWLNDGVDEDGLPLLLVDTRNDVEVSEGTFNGAIDLKLGKFTDLKTRILDGNMRDKFAGHRVVTFCTGGIRCEKAAIYMQHHGIPNVVQLEGGILRYFEEVGGSHWEGACFVFDDRDNVDPDLKPVKRRHEPRGL
jgi:UPF0176 protein